MGRTHYLDRLLGRKDTGATAVMEPPTQGSETQASQQDSPVVAQHPRKIVETGPLCCQCGNKYFIPMVMMGGDGGPLATNPEYLPIYCCGCGSVWRFNGFIWERIMAVSNLLAMRALSR